MDGWVCVCNICMGGTCNILATIMMSEDTDQGALNMVIKGRSGQRKLLQSINQRTESQFPTTIVDS